MKQIMAAQAGLETGALQEMKLLRKGSHVTTGAQDRRQHWMSSWHACPADAVASAVYGSSGNNS
jgi:hypothetical protein